MAFIDYISMEQVIKKIPVKVLDEKCLVENLDLSLPKWFLEDMNFSLSIKSSQENETFYEEFCTVSEGSLEKASFAESLVSLAIISSKTKVY